MKYWILLLLFFLGGSLIGQSTDEQGIKHFKLQFGLLYDAHRDKDYLGVNIIQLGILSSKDRRIKGIDLNGIYFKTPPVQAWETGMPWPLVDWQREKLELEVGGYAAYALFGSDHNGLYVGPMITLGYSDESFTPNLPTRYLQHENSGWIGQNLKIDYFLRLKQKLSLAFSTRLPLLGVSFDWSQVENPALPLRQQKFASLDLGDRRNRISLLLGLRFALGK